MDLNINFGRLESYSCFLVRMVGKCVCVFITIFVQILKILVAPGQELRAAWGIDFSGFFGFNVDE